MRLVCHSGLTEAIARNGTLAWVSWEVHVRITHIVKGRALVLLEAKEHGNRPVSLPEDRDRLAVKPAGQYLGDRTIGQAETIGQFVVYVYIDHVGVVKIVTMHIPGKRHCPNDIFHFRSDLFQRGNVVTRNPDFYGGLL